MFSVSSLVSSLTVLSLHLRGGPPSTSFFPSQHHVGFQQHIRNPSTSTQHSHESWGLIRGVMCFFYCSQKDNEHRLNANINHYCFLSTVIAANLYHLVCVHDTKGVLFTSRITVQMSLTHWITESWFPDIVTPRSVELGSKSPATWI